jgi:ATP-binding cassette subfamily B protein
LLAGEGRGAGLVLSAGERQLVSLARALVPAPKILLLDEATAAIDGESDATFRFALRTATLSRHCAVLTVAHRISTAREADRVLVIERGCVVEEGQPADLARAGGRFAMLAELEGAGWDWTDPVSSENWRHPGSAADDSWPFEMSEDIRRG